MMKHIKAFAHTTLRLAGYQIIRVARDWNLSYDRIYPIADYAPWNSDGVFLETYDAIKRNTMVDIYRCWELWSLVEQTAKLARGGIIEIGVWRGGTGALIAKKAAICDIESRVYLCDTFRGVIKAGTGDTAYRGGEHADTSRCTVETLLHTLGLPNVAILEGAFPDETAHLISDGEVFRFCHIDVDVYDSARDIIDWIWERLCIGGIVVFDDYGFHETNGITRFVNEQLPERDRIVIHNLNGHAVMVKTCVSA